ncbi:hypothetical protein RUND412_009276 [Rhizina undulata]
MSGSDEELIPSDGDNSEQEGFSMEKVEKDLHGFLDPPEGIMWGQASPPIPDSDPRSTGLNVNQDSPHATAATIEDRLKMLLTEFLNSSGGGTPLISLKDVLDPDILEAITSTPAQPELEVDININVDPETESTMADDNPENLASCSIVNVNPAIPDPKPGNRKNPENSIRGQNSGDSGFGGAVINGENDEEIYPLPENNDPINGPARLLVESTDNVLRLLDGILNSDQQQGAGNIGIGKAVVENKPAAERGFITDDMEQNVLPEHDTVLFDDAANIEGQPLPADQFYGVASPVPPLYSQSFHHQGTLSYTFVAPGVDNLYTPYNFPTLPLHPPPNPTAVPSQNRGDPQIIFSPQNVTWTSLPPQNTVINPEVYVPKPHYPSTSTPEPQSHSSSSPITSYLQPPSNDPTFEIIYNGSTSEKMQLDESLRLPPSMKMFYDPETGGISKERERADMEDLGHVQRGDLRRMEFEELEEELEDGEEGEGEYYGGEEY